MCHRLIDDDGGGGGGDDDDDSLPEGSRFIGFYATWG